MGKTKITSNRLIARRTIANPLRSAALVAEEFKLLEAAGIDNRKMLPGFIEADVNLSTMIGGLARVKGISKPQELAAARLRGLWERSIIGGAQAFDYASVRVDVSGAASSDDVDKGCDARAEFAAAIQAIGIIHSAVVVPIVLDDMSLRGLARWVGEGQGGAAIDRVKKRLLAGVDVLSSHFGYSGAPHGRREIRAEGDAPAMFSGVISTRKRSSAD